MNIDLSSLQISGWLSRVEKTVYEVSFHGYAVNNDGPYLYKINVPMGKACLWFCNPHSGWILAHSVPYHSAQRTVQWYLEELGVFSYLKDWLRNDVLDCYLVREIPLLNESSVTADERKELIRLREKNEELTARLKSIAALTGPL